MSCQNQKYEDRLAAFCCLFTKALYSRLLKKEKFVERQKIVKLTAIMHSAIIIITSYFEIDKDTNGLISQSLLLSLTIGVAYSFWKTESFAEYNRWNYSKTRKLQTFRNGFTLVVFGLSGLTLVLLWAGQYEIFYVVKCITGLFLFAEIYLPKFLAQYFDP